MEVILIKDMENLGYANDIVNVKPGYANNYLIPQGIAKAATATAKKVLAENLRQRAHKDAKILADAQALAETIHPAAVAGCQGRGGQALRYGDRCRPGRGSRRQRHHGGSQADQRRCDQDRRRVRGYGPPAQGGQGYDQILGYRCRIRSQATHQAKELSSRESSFFVFIGLDRHAARPERLCRHDVYGGSVVRNPATTQTGGTEARSPLFRHCVRQNSCPQNRSKASPQCPEGEGLPGRANPIPRVSHPASNRTPGCLPH